MLDNLIVFLYLLLVLLIGIYYRSKGVGFRAFATIKDKVGQSKILLTATFFTSSVGGGTIFGLAEKVFSGHISYGYASCMTAIVDVCLAFFVIPKLARHYGTQSSGDIMFRYYGNAGRLISGLAASVVCLGFLAIQISVSGRIFQYILGIEYLTGICISYSVIILYTTIGGLRSIVFTNLMQFFAIVITIPIIAVTNLQQIGFTNFVNFIGTDRVSVLQNEGLLAETIFVGLGFCVMGMYPHFVQRSLINANPQETSKAIYIKSSVFALFLGFVILNGLLAYYFFPFDAPELALMHLIDITMPTGIKGCVVVGLLAAVMSTAEAELNVVSVCFVKDVLGVIVPQKSQKTLLVIVRIINVLFGILSIIIALQFPSVIDLLMFVVGFWVPVVIVPMIFALYDITTSKRGLIFCSLASVIMFVSWENYYASTMPIKGIFVATIMSAVVFLVVRLVVGKGRVLVEHHL